jgi:hypothetical protein
VVLHRARWERLELYINRCHLHILDGPMPLLRYLNLCLDSPAVGTEAIEAPLLRNVILNNCAASTIILPWAQLTSLVLLYVSLHECVPILQQTSNLVRCKLGICDPHDNQPGPDLALPHLESLTLTNPYRRSVIAFPKTLIVPALRILEIPEHFLGINPVESLIAFISKSSCKLEEIQITGPRFVPSTSYRKAFPSIRTFSFSHADVPASD